jgi:SAM-dependent methyltransferase
MAETKNGRYYGGVEDIDGEKIKSFWDNNAKKDSSLKSVLLGYDFNENSANLHNEREKNILINFLAGRNKLDILDIGCGMGRWAYNLKSFIKTYHGIDFSEEFIKNAQKVFQNEMNIQFHCMSAIDIDMSVLLPNYDLVIVSEVSMYINDADLKKLYGYINRLTTGGGGLVYLQDTTSLLSTRLTLKDFESKELKTKYNAIYRTKLEYEKMFDKYLQEFRIKPIDGTDLLLDKETGAREETIARYWLLQKNVV